MLFSSAVVNRTDDGLGLLSTPIIHSFDENATSNREGGLMPNDKIVKVGNARINTGNQLSYEIMHQGYKSVDITVIRNGEKIILEDVSFGTFSESGVVFGSVDFYVYGERSTVINLLRHTFFNSCSMIKMVWDSLIDLITGRFGIEALSGPVGITEQIGESAKSGSTNFLYLISLITINLGVMNLLPFPALDGGRLMFLTIEGITRKKINPNVESYIHFVGIVILFGLMIFITFKDILNLF
jgi:regulator of sigma E protease